MCGRKHARDKDFHFVIVIVVFVVSIIVVVFVVVAFDFVIVIVLVIFIVVVVAVFVVVIFVLTVVPPGRLLAHVLHSLAAAWRVLFARTRSSSLGSAGPDDAPKPRHVSADSTTPARRPNTSCTARSR